MSQEKMDRADRVRYLLNRLALEICPPFGLLQDLALDLGVHPTTISLWMQAGNVPASRAAHMQRRYGIELAPAHELSRDITAPATLN